MALTGGWGGGPRSSCPGAAWNPGFTTRLSPEGSSGSEVSACSRHGQFLLPRPLGVNPRPLPPSRRASEASAEWMTPEPALRPDGLPWRQHWARAQEAGPARGQLEAAAQSSGRAAAPQNRHQVAAQAAGCARGGSGSRLRRKRTQHGHQLVGMARTIAAAVSPPQVPRTVQGLCPPAWMGGRLSFCGTTSRGKRSWEVHLPPPGCQRSGRWSELAPSSVPQPTAPVPLRQLPPVPAVHVVVA